MFFKHFKLIESSPNSIKSSHSELLFLMTILYSIRPHLSLRPSTWALIPVNIFRKIRPLFLLGVCNNPKERTNILLFLILILSGLGFIKVVNNSRYPLWAVWMTGFHPFVSGMSMCTLKFLEHAVLHIAIYTVPPNCVSWCGINGYWVTEGMPWMGRISRNIVIWESLKHTPKSQSF